MSYAVVILHGIFANEVVMAPLAKRIKRQGHNVLNITYNSFSLDTETLFESIDTHFKSHEKKAIVGWSLGGLLAREYIAKGSCEAKALDKVITIGTPNRGSNLAKTIAKRIPDVLQPGGAKFLLESHDAWPFDVNLHAIAGNTKLSLLPPYIVKDSDRLVSISETKIKGMSSHKIFNHDHFGLIFSRSVAEHVLRLLND